MPPHPAGPVTWRGPQPRQANVTCQGLCRPGLQEARDGTPDSETKLPQVVNRRAGAFTHSQVG
eukprot:485142-Hanusia_phi.AAC.1